jgi:excisionase family DNA binding protein
MPNELLHLAEAAAEARVSISTMRHWLATGRLQSVRPGRRRMVRRVDLDAFLRSDIGRPVSDEREGFAAERVAPASPAKTSGGRE